MTTLTLSADRSLLQFVLRKVRTQEGNFSFRRAEIFLLKRVTQAVDWAISYDVPPALVGGQRPELC